MKLRDTCRAALKAIEDKDRDGWVTSLQAITHHLREAENKPFVQLLEDASEASDDREAARLVVRGLLYRQSCADAAERVHRAADDAVADIPELQQDVIPRLYS